MGVDIAELRARISHWKPRMTVELRVSEVKELLDENDRLRRLLALERRLRQMRKIVIP